MSQTAKVQRVVTGFGALINAGSGEAGFLVGSAHQDFEIRHISFLSVDVSQHDAKFLWGLYHLGINGDKTKDLVFGKIEGVTLGKAEISNKATGTVGYQQPIYMWFNELSTDKLKNLNQVVITLDFEKVGEEQTVDTGVTPVWQQADEQESARWGGNIMDEKAKATMMWQGAVTSVGTPGQNIQNAEKGKMTDTGVQQ